MNCYQRYLKKIILMDEDYTDENFNFENHEGDFVDPCCDTDKSHLPTLHQKNMTFAKRF